MRPREQQYDVVVIGGGAAVGPGGRRIPAEWVAGNASDPSAQVMLCAAAGRRVGTTIDADLVAEETWLDVSEREAA